MIQAIPANNPQPITRDHLIVFMALDCICSCALCLPLSGAHPKPRLFIFKYKSNPGSSSAFTPVIIRDELGNMA